MRVILSLACLALLASAPLAAQRKPFVRVAAEGTVSFKPDQLRISVSVITQADTAQQASDDNAIRSTTVLDALRKLLGPSADLRTTSYSVSPIYRYPSGSQPVLAGYQASNTVEITTAELALAGRIIDVAVSAGATSVGGIRFGLKDPEPARQIALKLAAQKARSNAEAIASGINAKLGAIVSLEEASAVRTLDSSKAATAGTTIESGSLQITATVVIEAELVQ